MARGAALLAMFVFHFTWDLSAFGWIDDNAPFNPGFKLFGHAIAASFLVLAGLSLVLAAQKSPRLATARSFWMRLLQISLAAAAISVASYVLFPQSPIFFGILHCIALSSLIALPLVGAPWPVTASLGVMALAAPAALASVNFDAPLLWWTGLSSFEPASNDYRPLFPWLGFMLIGLAVGGIAQAKKLWPAAGGAPKNAFARALGFGGRHSLIVYLVHQPVFFVGFWSLALLVTAPYRTEQAVFLRQCAGQCERVGTAPKLCADACACVARKAKSAGIWDALVSDRLDEAQKRRVHDDAVACYQTGAEE
jgi:uncharacterized membrane protein